MHQPIDALRANTTLILTAQALLPYKEHFDALYDVDNLNNGRLCQELTRKTFVEGFIELIQLKKDEAMGIVRSRRDAAAGAAAAIGAAPQDSALATSGSGGLAAEGGGSVPNDQVGAPFRGSGGQGGLDSPSIGFPVGPATAAAFRKSSIPSQQHVGCGQQRGEGARTDSRLTTVKPFLAEEANAPTPINNKINSNAKGEAAGDIGRQRRRQSGGGHHDDTDESDLQHSHNLHPSSVPDFLVGKLNTAGRTNSRDREGGGEGVGRGGMLPAFTEQNHSVVDVDGRHHNLVDESLTQLPVPILRDSNNTNTNGTPAKTMRTSSNNNVDGSRGGDSGLVDSRTNSPATNNRAAMSASQLAQALNSSSTKANTLPPIRPRSALPPLPSSSSVAAAADRLSGGPNANGDLPPLIHSLDEQTPAVGPPTAISPSAPLPSALKNKKATTAQTPPTAMVFDSSSDPNDNGEGASHNNNKVVNKFLLKLNPNLKEKSALRRPSDTSGVEMVAAPKSPALGVPMMNSNTGNNTTSKTTMSIAQSVQTVMAAQKLRQKVSGGLAPSASKGIFKRSLKSGGSTPSTTSPATSAARSPTTTEQNNSKKKARKSAFEGAHSDETSSDDDDDTKNAGSPTDDASPMNAMMTSQDILDEFFFSRVIIRKKRKQKPKKGFDEASPDLDDDGGLQEERIAEERLLYIDDGYENIRCDLSKLYDALLSVKKTEIREYLKRTKAFYYESEDYERAKRDKRQIERFRNSYTFADLILFFDWSCAGIGAALRVTESERQCVTTALKKSERKIGVIERKVFIKEYVKEVTKHYVDDILDALFTEEFDLLEEGKEWMQQMEESGSAMALTGGGAGGVFTMKKGGGGAFGHPSDDDDDANAANLSGGDTVTDFSKANHLLSSSMGTFRTKKGPDGRRPANGERPSGWRPPQKICPSDFSQYLKAIDDYHAYVAKYDLRPPESELYSVGSKHRNIPDGGGGGPSTATKEFIDRALLMKKYDDEDDDDDAGGGGGGFKDNTTNDTHSNLDASHNQDDVTSPNGSMPNTAAPSISSRKSRRQGQKCTCEGIIHCYSEQLAFAADRVGRGLPQMIRSELRHAGFSIGAHRSALGEDHSNYNGNDPDGKKGGVRFKISSSDPNNPQLVISFEALRSIVGKAYLRWLETPEAIKDESIVKLKHDVKHVTLLLFPNDDMSPMVVGRLLNMLEKRPDLNTFTHSYSEMKAQKSRDYWDLGLFCAVIVCFIILAFSGRGMSAGAYDGYGVLNGFKNGRDSTEFYECHAETDIINGTAGTDYFCESELTNGDTMDLHSLVKQAHIYSLMGSFIPNFLWPEANTTAAKTVISATLAPIGALRIRQRRAKARHIPRRIRIPTVNSELNDPSQDLATALSTNAEVIYGFPYLSDLEDTEDKSPHPALYMNQIIRELTVVDNGGPLGNVDGGYDYSHFGNYGGVQYESCTGLEGSGYVSVYGDTRAYSCGGYAIDIPFNNTREEYLAVIDEVVKNRWIDKASRAVLLEYFLYHRNSGMVLMAKHLLEMHAGGGMTHTMMASPFFLPEAGVDNRSVFATFVFFVFFCLIYTARVSYRMLLTIQAPTIDFIRLFVLILELLNIVIFVYSVSTFRGIADARTAYSDPVWQVDHYPRSYEEAFTLYDTTAIANCVNIVLSLMLCLSYTQNMPSFRPVVRTLRRAAKPAVAIGFVAFSTLIGFAVCAAVTFGERILHYHTIPDAIASLLTLVWDSWSFDILYTNDQRIFGGVFIIFFNVIFTMFLLNALTAVFTDAFDDEGEATFDPTNLMAIVASDYFAAIRKQRTWGSVLRWPYYILQGFASSMLVSFRRRPIIHTASGAAALVADKALDAAEDLRDAAVDFKDAAADFVDKGGHNIVSMFHDDAAAEEDAAARLKLQGADGEQGLWRETTMDPLTPAMTVRSDGAPDSVSLQRKEDAFIRASQLSSLPLPSITYNQYNYYTQIYVDLWMLKDLSEGNTKDYEGAIRCAARMIGFVHRLKDHVPRVDLDDIFVDKTRKCLFQYCERELFDDEGVTDDDEDEEGEGGSSAKGADEGGGANSLGNTSGGGLRSSSLGGDGASPSGRSVGRLSRRESLASSNNSEAESLLNAAKKRAAGASRAHSLASFRAGGGKLGTTIGGGMSVATADDLLGMEAHEEELLREELDALRKEEERRASPNIDYNLVMTLFAIVPQFEFGWSALDELLEAVSARKLYWQNARATTIVADRMERREAREDIDAALLESIKSCIPAELSDSEDDDDGEDEDGSDRESILHSDTEFNIDPTTIGIGVGTSSALPPLNPPQTPTTAASAAFATAGDVNKKKILDANEFVPLLDHLERRTFLGIIASRFLNTDSKYISDKLKQDQHKLSETNRAAAREEANESDCELHQGPAQTWEWKEFFGDVSGQTRADDSKAKILNYDLFMEIVESLKNPDDASLARQGKLLPPYTDGNLLWRSLEMPSDDHCLRLSELLPLIQIEFAPQTLGFSFSLDEALTFCKFAESISSKRYLQARRRQLENGGTIDAGTNNGLLSSGDYNIAIDESGILPPPHMLASSSNTMSPMRGGGAAAAAAVPFRRRVAHEADDDVMLTSVSMLKQEAAAANPFMLQQRKKELNRPEAILFSPRDATATANAATATTTAIPIDTPPPTTAVGDVGAVVLDRKYLTEAEFAEAWKHAKGSAPTAEDLGHVMNIFPKDTINWQLFAHACQGEPTAMNRQSFPTVLAANLSKHQTYHLSFLVYLPTLLIYFLHLLSMSQGETVQIAQSMRQTFTPSDPASTHEDVLNWIRDDLVGGIWGGEDENDGINGTSVNATVPPARSADNEGVNYFIGALRIMQWRVEVNSRKECEVDYDRYFGDTDKVGHLRVPKRAGNSQQHVINTATDEVMAFYNERAGEAFPHLYELKCYSNWNGGKRAAATFYAGGAGNEGPAVADVIANFSDLHPVAQTAFSSRKMDIASSILSSTQGHDDSYPANGYYFDLPFTFSADEVGEILSQVLDNEWIDLQTRMVAAKMVTYNQNMQMIATTRVGYELSSGGNMAPFNHVDIVTIRQPADKWSDPVSTLLFVFAIFYLARNLQEMYITVKRRRVLASWLRDGVGSVISLDLYLWTNMWIHTVVVSVILGTSIYRMVQWGQNQIPDGMTLVNDNEYPETFEYDAQVSGIIRALEGTNFLILTALCTIFVTKTIRFEVILETIAVAYKDLLAIGSLFVIVVLAFTCGMQLLWGYELELASSFGTAFIHMFIGATTGNGVTEDMFPPRKFIGNMFQLFFVIISNVILNNTVTGRISAAFKTVKEGKYQSAVTAASIERYDVFTRHDGLELLMTENRKLFSRKWWRKVHLPQMLFNFGVKQTIIGSFMQVGYNFGRNVDDRLREKQWLWHRPKKTPAAATAASSANNSVNTQMRLPSRSSRMDKSSRRSRREIASRRVFSASFIGGKSAQLSLAKQLEAELAMRFVLLKKFRFSISHYWSSMSDWWLKIDCGMPFEAAIAGTHLIGIRHSTPEIEMALGRDEQSYDAKRTKKNRLNGIVIDPASPTTTTATTPAGGTSHGTPALGLTKADQSEDPGSVAGSAGKFNTEAQKKKNASTALDDARETFAEDADAPQRLGRRVSALDNEANDEGVEMTTFVLQHSNSVKRKKSNKSGGDDGDGTSLDASQPMYRNVKFAAGVTDANADDDDDRESREDSGTISDSLFGTANKLGEGLKAGFFDFGSGMKKLGLGLNDMIADALPIHQLINMQKILLADRLAKRTRLSTFGTFRRLPLWEELLYDKLQDNEGHTGTYALVRDYFLTIPAILYGKSERAMGLTILEEKHYYDQLQQTFGIESVADTGDEDDGS